MNFLFQVSIKFFFNYISHYTTLYISTDMQIWTYLELGFRICLMCCFVYSGLLHQVEYMDDDLYHF